MDWSLRPERPDDDEFLFRLYAESRAAELAVAPWTEAEKDAFLHSQFQLQRSHYRLYYAEARFDVIEHEGRPVGRLYVHRGAHEIRLMDIALIPAYRNRGWGSELIRRLTEEAEADSKTISLYVEADNPARRLYGRMGFRPIGEHGPYLLMERRPASNAGSAPAIADQPGDAGG